LSGYCSRIRRKLVRWLHHSGGGNSARHHCGGEPSSDGLTETSSVIVAKKQIDEKSSASLSEKVTCLQGSSNEEGQTSALLGCKEPDVSGNSTSGGVTNHTSVVLKQLRGNRAVFTTRSEVLSPQKCNSNTNKPHSEVRFSIGRFRLCNYNSSNSGKSSSNNNKKANSISSSCCCRKYCVHLRYANPASCCGALRNSGATQVGR